MPIKNPVTRSSLFRERNSSPHSTFPASRMLTPATMIACTTRTPTQRFREAEPVPEIHIRSPRVARSLPPDGPFYAAVHAGLTDLWKEHPNADGRGVTVAVTDEGIDLLHPKLQQARDSNGDIVPKFADLATLTTQQEANWVEFAIRSNRR